MSNPSTEMDINMVSASKDNNLVDNKSEYGLRPEAAQFPMMSVLSFVYPCNALCPHCPYTNSSIRQEFKDVPFMPEKTFKKIADESGRIVAPERCWCEVSLVAAFRHETRYPHICPRPGTLKALASRSFGRNEKRCYCGFVCVTVGFWVLPWI